MANVKACAPEEDGMWSYRIRSQSPLGAVCRPLGGTISGGCVGDTAISGDLYSSGSQGRFLTFLKGLTSDLILATLPLCFGLFFEAA